MYFTDDPVRDAERYFAEQDREMDKLPKCKCCEEPITDYDLYDIDGDLYCTDCMNKLFRKDVADYVNG